MNPANSKVKPHSTSYTVQEKRIDCSDTTTIYLAMIYDGRDVNLALILGHPALRVFINNLRRRTAPTPQSY